MRIAAAIFLLLGTGLAFAETVVPVHEEPRHRLVWEGGDIRVFSTSIPAGDRSLYHRHEDPTLYVLLNASLVRNQDLGAGWVEPDPSVNPPPGAFLFRNYRKEPQEHRVENAGNRSFQVIGVIHRGAGVEGPVTGPARPEVANRWFAGYRYRLAPGEATAAHRHADPAVVVQVSSGVLSVVEEGCARVAGTVAGTWFVHEPGREHVLRNDGDVPLELVEMEARGAAAR
jgi:quercetin dioxygenase-like cupin family protein